MAKEFVKPYLGQMEFTFELYEKFLVLCPENIWQEKFGGWPVCLQYYHALAATGMLIGSISGHKANNPVPEAGNLGESLQHLPTNAQAKIYLLNLKKAFADTAAGLNDEDLLKKNEPVSVKFDRDVSIAETLELMACHMQYHLGACDGALRNTGLAAAF